MMFAILFLKVVTSDSLVKSADLLANGKGSVNSMDTSGSLGNEASNEETANVVKLIFIYF